jgi:hypothetical protein
MGFSAQRDHLMVLKKCLKIVGLLALVAGYGICFSQVHNLRSNMPAETRRAQALAIDPTLLKVISGPFKGLVADYLNIKASVFMGGAYNVTDEDWEAVYTLLKQSLYLDPLFFQSGYYIQGLLAWRNGMHQKATELLAYQAEQRYWDWEPMFYAGFDYFHFLNDTESAAKCLKASAERPGAPPLVSSLAARLAQKAGHTLTSIGLLKTMYESAEEGPAKEYYGKRLQASLEKYDIENALKRFQQIHSRWPENLDELVSSGIIPKIPENPLGVPFIYDPHTGRVDFDEVRSSVSIKDAG